MHVDTRPAKHRAGAQPPNHREERPVDAPTRAVWPYNMTVQRDGSVRGFHRAER